MRVVATETSDSGALTEADLLSRWKRTIAKAQALPKTTVLGPHEMHDDILECESISLARFAFWKRVR